MQSLARSFLPAKLVLGLAAMASSVVASSLERKDDFGLQPFSVNLSAGVPRMLDLVKNTVLPKEPVYPGLGSSAGMDLDLLTQLQKVWTTEFDWAREEAALNKYHHFTAELEGLTVHFIHEKSSEPGAIPLVLLHGWPGSFLEFLPVVSKLTEKAATSTGKPVAFDVVVPSLPGFAFSSGPSANWTIDDTARVLHALMTRVLGYRTFAVHGTDWGSAVAYSLYANFGASTRAAHLAFLPFLPLASTELAAQGIALSPLEQLEAESSDRWVTVGSGHTLQQKTRPTTIGLALQDNPIGQLVWIGDKFVLWSDPRAGTPPSVIDHNEILRSVSLYYLTGSFTSSTFIYYQNPQSFGTNYTRAPTDAPLLFSAFRYNVGFWPPAVVARVGNLVLYRNHDFGGHFPSIDNPPAMVDDLREIGSHWQ